MCVIGDKVSCYIELVSSAVVYFLVIIIIYESIHSPYVMNSYVQLELYLSS